MAQDQVVVVERTARSKIQWAMFSLVISIVLFSLKYWAYAITHSQAVLSDALETLVNIVAAAVALAVIRWASRPADIDHPYGHGKAEWLSAAFEGGLVSAAAAVILFQAVKALIRPHELTSLGTGLYITIGAALINGAVGIVLIQRGRRLHSAALVASGVHLLSDLITTVGTSIGLVLVMVTGLVKIDSLAALIVGIYLLYTGFKVMRGAAEGLLDKVDPDILEKLNAAVNSIRLEGIIQLHHVRVLAAGSYRHIDAHVVVPEFWDIKRVHAVTKEYERRILENLSLSGEMHLHIDPCERKYCANCPVEPCPIRLEPFTGYRRISIEEMIAVDEPRRKNK